MNLSQCLSFENLSARGTLTLHGRVGARIRGKTGSVWITQEGDSRDHLIDAGQSLTLDRNGKLVLFAFDPALVCIDPPLAATNRGPGGARAVAQGGAGLVRTRLARWAGAVAGALRRAAY